MVFDERLGYDPDEWEECPEPEHVVLVSPFMRYVLTAAAIAFVYYFFKILGDQKNEKNAAEKETEKTKVEQVASSVGQKLQEIPQSAQDLLNEADQYLKENGQSLLTNGQKLVEKAISKIPSLDVDIDMSKPIEATKETFENTLSAVETHLNETNVMDLSPKSRDSTTHFEQISENSRNIENLPPHLKRAAEEYYAQQQQQQTPEDFQQQYQLEGGRPQGSQQQQQYPPEAFQQQYQLEGSRHPAQQQQQQYLPEAFQQQYQLEGGRSQVPQQQQHYPPEAFQHQYQLEGSRHPAQQQQQQQYPTEGFQQHHQLEGGRHQVPQQQQQYLPDAFQQQYQLEGGRPQVPQQQQQYPHEAFQQQYQLDAARPPVPQHQHHPIPISPSDQQLLNEFAIYDAPPPANSQGSLPRRLTREKRLSEQDERALQDWEQEKALLEADRIKKLLDHEVGGDSNTDLSNFAPTSLPTYQSRSGDDAQIQPPARQAIKPVGMSNVRDSQLTDYDISEFKESHDGWADHSSVPKAIQEHRRTTGDSDDYVKVNEPIYDLPPRAPADVKRISPTEAAQLQELCQEYDLGLDLPGVPAKSSGSNVMMRQDSTPQSQKTMINVPISRRTDVPIQQVPVQQMTEDPRNLATADLFVQDAIEYLGNQEKQPFVMEEDMLNSHEKTAANRKSLEGATSRQVRTNEVFERMETDEHDDMTYAPEIQSVEIPPDQMSESSENMIDYFDKVAAESDAQIQKLQQQQEQQNTLRKQQAPQILPAFGSRATSNSSLGSTGRSSSDVYPYRNLRKQSSLLSVLGVTSMQEMLLTINTLDSLSEAMRRAGLETTNLIFGIDYTASNKYQGEESFGGRSLHTIHPHVKNPYQQVITILGRTLAPFAGGRGNIGVYGFGDAKTGDWSTFNLSPQSECRTLDEVLSVYNSVTPRVALSGPTNFAPLIYQAMETCQASRDYHILVIIADGQVTNERATRRAIVQACQHPLSIIVVGVGDGPWDMMRVFDESLPKRPWDNFHFVEFHEIIKKSTSVEDGDVKVAVQSLLEIPDQYRCICELGLLDQTIPPRGSEIRRELMHNPL